MFQQNQPEIAFDENDEIIDVDSYDFTSGFDTERIIFLLDADQASVLVLRYLGFKAPEIVKIMGMKRIKNYYKINHALRKIVSREMAREGYE